MKRIALLLTLITLGTTYPRAMQVATLDREKDVVYCIDGVGMKWSFYGCEDWEKGDLVVCTMHTNGTDVISDDYMLDIRYGGYNFPLYRYGMFDTIGETNKIKEETK